MDIVSKEVRSRMMAGIRGSNTSPEMKIRSLLHRHGFRYRLHRKDLPGKPDVVLPRHRVCIFVHGCFWHRHPRCRYATIPKTREEFWRLKFDQNVKRDIRNRDELLQQGWRVFELWECGIRGPEADMNWLLEAIQDCNQKYISWPDFPYLNTFSPESSLPSTKVPAGFYPDGDAQTSAAQTRPSKQKMSK